MFNSSSLCECVRGSGDDSDSARSKSRSSKTLDTISCASISTITISTAGSNNNLKDSKELSPQRQVYRVEDALEKLGGYSWFQLWATIIIISPEISAAMIALSPILIGSSRVPFECQTSNETYEFLETDAICTGNCSGIFRPLGVVTSVVQEWELICDRKWVSDAMTSMQMTGSMIGALGGSHVADVWGRKKTYFCLCFLMGAFGCISGVTWNPWAYAATRFFAGLAIGGCFVVYLNYLMEFLTPSYRTICGCVSLWSFGEMMLALLGYCFPSWRDLSRATSLPIFLLFFTYPLIPESPRFLLVKGRTEECGRVFDQIARWNRRKPLTPEELRALQEGVRSQTEKVQVSIWSIFKSAELRKQLLILCLSWFSAAAVFYGMSFNMKHLSGDPYLNVLYLGMVDFPGSFSGILFNNRFGRRRTFLGFLLVGSVFLLALVVVETTQLIDTYPMLETALNLMGRFCNSASWAVMACFTAESFPTFGRATCMGICAFAGNLGGIVAPQFIYLRTLSRSVPYISYFILNVLSACGAILLKDMTGLPLEDKIS